jgi:hypothetical protein
MLEKEAASVKICRSCSRRMKGEQEEEESVRE